MRRTQEEREKLREPRNYLTLGDYQCLKKALTLLNEVLKASMDPSTLDAERFSKLAWSEHYLDSIVCSLPQQKL